RLDNTQESRSVAYNVDAAEGDLKSITREQLAAELADVNFQFQLARDAFWDTGEVQGKNLSQALLYGLIILLLAEQLLAYSASYHPAKPQGARSHGRHFKNSNLRNRRQVRPDARGCA